MQQPGGHSSPLNMPDARCLRHDRPTPDTCCAILPAPQTYQRLLLREPTKTPTPLHNQERMWLLSWLAKAPCTAPTRYA
jgi:hypothetical protein